MNGGCTCSPTWAMVEREARFGSALGVTRAQGPGRKLPRSDRMQRSPSARDSASERTPWRRAPFARGLDTPTSDTLSDVRHDRPRTWWKRLRRSTASPNGRGSRPGAKVESSRLIACWLRHRGLSLGDDCSQVYSFACWRCHCHRRILGGVISMIARQISNELKSFTPCGSPRHTPSPVSVKVSRSLARVANTSRSRWKWLSSRAKKKPEGAEKETMWPIRFFRFLDFAVGYRTECRKPTCAQAHPSAFFVALLDRTSTR